MSDQSPKPPMQLGVYEKPKPANGRADTIAIGLTVLWILAVILFFWLTPAVSNGPTGPTLVMSILATVLPLALIWIATTMAKTTRALRDEAARLQASINVMRAEYANREAPAASPIKPAMERKLDEIAASQIATQSAIATFASTRASQLPSAGSQPARMQPGLPEGDSQPALALGTPAEALAPPLSVDDFIGALNFPLDENDTEGFDQMRRALADRESAKLVRAAQDVLTLLSQDGIYMDDLSPDRARAELWRKFAAGERGRAIAGLGGVHDRTALALAAGRMRSDPVFRDTVHHFLRQFDRTFVEFAEAATDADITRLADTRTCRAFMILGRVTGTFD